MYDANALGDLDLMAALVQRELRHKERSQWAPLWESMLPNDSSIVRFKSLLLLNWSELESFAKDGGPKGRLAAKEAERIKHTLHKRYARSKLLAQLGTLDNFIRTVALVQSRVFGVAVRDAQGKWHRARCLVPFADLVNYCNDINLECQTNVESTHFECTTTRAIEAGSFLCASYAGDDDRVSLLLNYGFVPEPPLPADTIDGEEDEDVAASRLLFSAVQKHL
jgi:hypothetical protein